MADDEREQAEQFTDEELAFLRFARFGELPARVRPSEMVETVDADAERQEPQQPMVRREWG
jgi:hypothetical protein